MPLVQPDTAKQAAIVDILEQVEAGRGGAEQEFEQLIRQDPEQFCREGLALLGSGEPVPGGERLARALLNLDAVIAEFCDPRRDPRQLKTAAKVLFRIEPALDVRLLRAVWDARSKESAAILTHVLEVVSSFSDGNRTLPILIQILRSPDEKVRSKAALLAARGRKDPVWLRKWLTDPDPRIRANAVEALWHDSSEGALDLFRKAAADPHHRVQANACIGLCYAKLKEGEDGLERMSRSPNAAHGAAACWAMGYLEDPTFIPLLKSLIGSPHGVGFNAVRALARIHRAQKREAAAEPPLEKVS
ncbi:MAG: HEAT repeat domain-containing protein [Bryobacterales bacterium]|nr:HEAT repeat domain-containing protein [Bryobacterales bacterium]